MDPVIIDIETVPIRLDDYMQLPEEEQLKKLNPIDSKIIAIGIKHKGETIILSKGPEKGILEEFWKIWSQKVSVESPALGFNIKQFDLPFIVARSFIQNVKVVPFVMKNVIELRDQINAFRYGATRGKLKEFAEIIGMPNTGLDGSDVARLFFSQQYDKIDEYLGNDLDITEKLYLRAKETNILDIGRY